MGSRKVITVGEHHIKLPSYPASKDSVYLINEKKEDAVWRRIEFPDFYYQYIPKNKAGKDGVYTKLYQKATIYDQDGKLIMLSEDDTKTLFRLNGEDLYRRKYGLWANIGGQVIWIAPDYYYALQWAPMKDLPEKYGSFRWIQNDVMIMWWYVKLIDWAAGLMLPKCKKSGITQVVSAAFLNESTMVEGFEFGAASKEFDHVKNVFMAYYFHSFDSLPLIMQPDIAKRNGHEIVYGRLAKRSGAKGDSSNDSYLGTRVNGYKTKVNCFDGPVMKRGFLDELPKWFESSNVHPDSVLKTNVEAVKLQQKINGKLFVGSYMPEEDDAGFHEFADWCKKSKLATRGDGKRTTSNLLLLPLTAIESNEQCFDKFGRCDEIKAANLVAAEYNSKTSIADKMAHKRQYPTCEDDMFDAGGRGSLFDNERLSVQHRNVLEEERTGLPPWKWMRLRWSREEWNSSGKTARRPLGEFSAVIREYITPEEVAKTEIDPPFKEFVTLPDEYYNQVIMRGHKHEIDYKKYTPLHWKSMLPGVISFDPTDYILKSAVTDGSDNAGQGGFIFDSGMDAKFGFPVTNRPIIEYHFREEDPDDDFESLVMFIILTGWRVIVESNKPWVVKKLRDEGLHHFLIIKDSLGILRPYQMGDVVSGPAASTEFIENYVRAIKRWTAPPKYRNEIDYIKYILSPTTLIHLMKFNAKDTKPFDCAVSLGWWRLGIEALSLWLMNQILKEGEVEEEGVEEAFNGLLDL